MSRAIVHLDADAFFASVEQAADPKLRGKPVAVGGEKRGIIASASYEARRFGIYTPMPTVRARKLCPKLLVLPGDFDKYEQFSRWMFSYAYDFTPDVEVSSIDEGYFDLTGLRKPAAQIAGTIRDAIQQALKIRVSEGIASNKLVSQIASKLYKPAAFFQVPAGEESSFLRPLKNIWLPGVGPKTAVRLNAAGLALIGQIAATPTELLCLLVGNMAPALRQFANGKDERPIVPAHEPAKSYGHQETFGQDQTDEARMEAVLRRMADSLMAKVREDHKAIRTVTVKVRYNDMAEEQASESLLEPTNLETELYGKLEQLLRKAWKRRVSLRMAAVRFSNVYEGVFNCELAWDGGAESLERKRRLAMAVDVLRRTHGRGVILRGHDFLLRETEKSPPPAPPPGEEKTRYPRETRNKNQLKVSGKNGVANEGVKSTLKRAGLGGARGERDRYVPLRVHSCYSFLDSTLTMEAIAEIAAAHELPAVAVTDRGNLHGAAEWVLLARKKGIQPILGAEIEVGGRRVQLYVETLEGYRNLCRILSEPGNGRPFGRAEDGKEPGIEQGSRKSAEGMGKEIEIARLAPFTRGLLAAGPMGAEDVAALFPDRFYWAVEGPEGVEALGRKRGRFPAAASLPAHYGAAADRWKWEVVQSIRTRTLWRQEHPEKRLTGDFHFRAPAEMRALFGRHPELLERGREIAGRCAWEFPFGKPQFPGFHPPDGSEPPAFLRGLVLEGLRRRYPDRHDGMRAQVEEELMIISEVGYEEYFLVVWDILRECRRQGIEWITRGSAADSLVCYCLEISDVCPIRFGLYFRRFLNRDRMQLNKLPDIDLDFPHDRKDDVIDLIFRKHGAEFTAVVGGFSTYRARGAMGDVAKVLGVSEQQIRRFTEKMPSMSARGMAEAVTRNLECRDLPLEEEPYRTALRMAEFLDGFPRYPKMHPCGVVLSRQPMAELTATFCSNKGYPSTHYDMDAVELMGLIKIDVLAQGGLAVMRDARESLRERGVELDFKKLEPWEDGRVWEMIAGGGARAVHHIESPAMVGLCRMCDVREIDGLIAIVSVIRPGAANEQKKARFTRRYQGFEPATYPDPSLEACLKSTYGLVVYEEHILQICEAFAGLPPGRADVLRRALGKEKGEVIEEIRGEFFAAARARGHEMARIEEVWELVAGFKGYAFCKAHSTAYGVEAYQSAWLKRYYPAEFMAGVLSNGKGFYHPLVYILECHRLGLRLLPPRVNSPGPKFTVEEGKIRTPALRVKGLTEKTRERWLREKERGEFASLADFYRRARPLAEEMEALIRAGALDEFGRPRTAQYWEARALCRAFDPADEKGQGWLLPPEGLDRLPDAPLQEPNRRERLEAETELLDFAVSGHPLELYEGIAWDTYCPVAELGNYPGEEVVTCGLVIEQRLHHQTTGEPMKFMTLADWTGMVETELFADTYRSYGLATVRYPVLEIAATVEPFENRKGYSLRVRRAGKPRTVTKTS